jgi:hypothetical protein
MKTLGATLALMLLSIPCQGQIGGFDLSKVSISTGRSSLSSGLDVTATFQNSGNKELELTGEQDQGWGVYRWKFHTPVGEVKPAVTAGVFQNAPWGGPQLIWEPTKSIMMMHWTGWSMGNPNHPAWNPKFFTHFSGIYLQKGAVGVGYGVLKYQHEKWRQLPGASLSGSFGPNKKFGWFSSVDYDVTAKEPLYKLAGTWKK